MSSKFISKKLIKELRSNNKFSRPIIRVSIISIAISILVMLLAVSIVKSFQKEIKDKVVNFGSHIQIADGGANFSFESSPIIKRAFHIDQISSIKGVEHIQTFAIKPGIIQSKADTQQISKDEEKIIRDIEGVVFKGINHDFKTENLASKIKEGNVFKWNTKKASDSIVISSFLAKKLKLNLHDPIACYFIKGNGPRLKRFVISGIYETGLEEFDKQFTFIDIRHIQKLNNWGIESNLFLSETCENNQLEVRAITTGGNKKYIYNWGKGYTSTSKLSFCPTKDTTIQVISSCYEVNNNFRRYPSGIPDTAWLTIKTSGGICPCKTGDSFEYDSPNDSARVYSSSTGALTTISKTTGGTMKNYIGGYEVFIDDFSKIDEIEYEIDVAQDLLKTSKITDLYREIFGWLNILDTNVIVIIILMILVATINIISLLLVLIIERSSMIGLLKSFGAENLVIQRIFISLGGFILSRGLIIGNVLAIAIILIQKYFGVIKLPQENYFLDKVPMNIEIVDFVILNIMTIVISYGVLYLASLFIVKINPIKTIKFN